MKYNVKCEKCGEAFMWDSKNPNKVCESCMGEDASVNSLGAIPTGRLTKRQVRPVENKESSMSKAKEMMKRLFEEETEPKDEVPPVDDVPPEDVEGDEQPQDLPACCDELVAAINELEDGEQKDKLLAIADKMKGMCAPAVPPEETEPESEEEPTED